MFMSGKKEEHQGEFTQYGDGHAPSRGIYSYQTDTGETMKITNDNNTLSFYDRPPSDPNHSGEHITDNGDGTFSVKTHGPDGDKGEPARTGHW